MEINLLTIARLPLNKYLKTSQLLLENSFLTKEWGPRESFRTRHPHMGIILTNLKGKGWVKKLYQLFSRNFPKRGSIPLRGK